MAAVLGAAALTMTALAHPAMAEQATTAAQQPANRYEALIPAPLEADAHQGPAFELGPHTVIRTQRGSDEARQVGEYLAEQLRPATGYPIKVTDRAADGPSIALLLQIGRASCREEGHGAAAASSALD